MERHRYLDLQVLRFLRICARKVARKYRLKYRRISLFEIGDPEEKTSHGMCYPDGCIEISLYMRGRRKLCRIECLVDTVIHELAHTRYPNHKKQFWALHKRMKRWFLKQI